MAESKDRQIKFGLSAIYKKTHFTPVNFDNTARLIRYADKSFVLLSIISPIYTLDIVTYCSIADYISFGFSIISPIYTLDIVTYCSIADYISFGLQVLIYIFLQHTLFTKPHSYFNCILFQTKSYFIPYFQREFTGLTTGTVIPRLDSQQIT